MLALLAALVLSPCRVLPEPFLPNTLRPVLPVDALGNTEPISVARGSYWRAGGILRITYYYRFALGKGPTHKQVMRQKGFVEEIVANGEQLANRAARDQGNVRQTVRIMDLADGTVWPWAKVSGPATIAVVTEMPNQNPAVWHQISEIMKPPVPPEFPPKFDCFSNCEVLEVRSDPIVPRFFRTTFSVQVRIASRLSPTEMVNGIAPKLPTQLWVTRRSGDIAGMRLKKTNYGLYYIEVKPYDDPNGTLRSEANLSYLYDDSANAPRLLD